ncbi:MULTISPECIES: hypothetical protein [Actinomycetes]|uniref:Mannose-6-phosphate isomerase n=2 Tax=Actinomycetes TaxID=1760 RepID=A0ABP6M3A8_9MICC
MIVALEDGFQALSRWRAHLRQVDEGRTHLGAVVAWLLAAEEAAGVVPALLAAEETRQPVDAEQLAPWDLIRRLQTAYPGDPGIPVAVMLHHLTLRAGESLWLPAGVLHAYVQGIGVELMGPSDNVLRGGLTSKHIDVAELLRIADLTPGRPRPTAPMPLEEHLLAHRADGQEQAPFELMEITGAAEVATPGPSVLIVLDGTFTVSSPTSGPCAAGRGAQLLHTDPGRLRLRGVGRAFLAKPRG